MNNRCLYCYNELTEDEMLTHAGKAGYHARCSRKFYRKPIPPELPYDENELEALTQQAVKDSSTLTGGQPELLLEVERLKKGQFSHRFLITRETGEYILKPQNNRYEHLPEIENLTMHLATLAGIKTINHALIFTQTGQPAYIAKRIDRIKGKKLQMEDICQLTGRLTEQRYEGSYEEIAETILKYSETPGFDVIGFYEIVLFCFLTGINDMHLKNFSLIEEPVIGFHLSPAYNLVSTQLIRKDDDKDLALTLNGKKNDLNLKDFLIAMLRAGITDKTIKNILGRFSLAIPKWHDFIDISFLTFPLKQEYHELITRKAGQIGLAG